MAHVHAAIARQAAAGRLIVGDAPVPLPPVLLSGGETTVTVRGKGRGGRNAEFVLALALALDGHPASHALACDTDGIDGTEDNAGAVIAPDTLARAAALGLDLKAHACRQRRLWRVRRAGRSRGHRPDVHQCQRFSRDTRRSRRRMRP